MDIGIIGSGRVAQTLAAKLLSLGHAVTISSRDPRRQKEGVPSAASFAAEQERQGHTAAAGSFADAAAFGEVLINATEGGHSLEALQAAGAEVLEGKILVDVANPLDFSGGMPPTLLFCNTDSLAERIQRAFPGARVVKTLNTVNAAVMVDPGALPEETTMFVAGDDQAAKDWVRDELLTRWFGWRQVLDLGDISSARAVEMWLPLWLRLWGATGTALMNLKVVSAT